MRCVSVDKELFANFPIIETFPTVLCFILNAKKLQIRLNGYTLAHRQQNHCYQMDMNHQQFAKKKAESDHSIRFIFFLYSYSAIVQYFPWRPNPLRPCRVMISFMMHGYAQKN